jgi:uncharacterized membrane protein YqaE (UPF0057 family)
MYLFSCNSIASGSYSHANIYKYNISKDTLIEILLRLKEKDSSLIPPLGVGLVDGMSDNSDYWYHIYFFNKNKNEIIHTWVRAQDNEITNLAFVGINQGLQLGNWKEINKDFDEKENDIRKREFENFILNRLNIKPVKNK